MKSPKFLSQIDEESYLFDVEESAKMFHGFLEEAYVIFSKKDNNKKPITVIINSPGGSADSGFGIYDMLKFIKPPIITITAGLCAMFC